MEAGQGAGKTRDAIRGQPTPEAGVMAGVAIAVDEDLAHLGAKALQHVGYQGLPLQGLQSLVHAPQSGGQSTGEDDGSDFLLRHNRRMIPHYWNEAIRQLAEGDPTMAGLIDRFPGLGLSSRGDAFGTLARSIVGQQISVKAADAVWARFANALGQVAPETVLAAGEAGLAGCGLSRRKMEYLIDLAGHFAAGRIRPERWAAMEDEAVIAELADVRGIGRWTAEMFLIFNLLRPDVYPLDDIGLQRAVFDHYFAGEKQPRRVLAEFGERWRPWRTVATWYLWRSLDPLPVEY
jgi:DNA-3-methyladenine glycosylase II